MSIVTRSRIHTRHAIADLTHGTQRAYKNGCHCIACTEGARRAANIYKLNLLRNGARTTDPTGTRRRILALGMLGWPHHRIAADAGLTTRQVQRIAAGVCETVHVKTAAAIRDVYDALSMSVAPAGINRAEKVGRALVIRAAKAHGGAVPLAWDDSTIDDPSATPDLGTDTLTPSQRHAENVADLLASNPLATLAHLADRLGLTANGLHVALVRAGADNLRERLNRNAELEGHTVRRSA